MKRLKKIIAVMLIIIIIDSMFSISIFSANAAYNYLFPVNNGGSIAYGYGYSASYGAWHDGIDIHSNGDDTIYAACDGVVEATANSCYHVSCGYQCEHYNTYGNYIRIGNSDGTKAYYGHLKQNSLLVSVGQSVKRGQPIATMGSSGYSTGKHLHFELRTSNYSTKINTNPTSIGGEMNYSTSGYRTEPTHDHNFYYAGAVTDHPHYRYYRCSCGETKYDYTNVWESPSCPHCSGKINYNPNGGNIYDDEVIVVDIQGINTFREAASIVVYSDKAYSTSPANQFGDEVSFDNKGKKIAIRTYGSETGLSIPAGGFVVSKHATSNVDLYSLALKSSYAYCDYNRKKVYFFKNEHDYQVGTKVVTPGGKYGYLTEPVREGYSFIGWFSDLTGEKQIYPSTIHSGQNTLYAQWRKNDKISFNLNGGEYKSKGSIYTVNLDGINAPRYSGNIIAYTQAYGNTTNTNYYGYEFAFNRMGKKESIRVYGTENACYIPQNGFVISAHAESNINVYDIVMNTSFAHLDSIKKQVIFYSDESDYNFYSKYISSNESYGYLPIPTKDGYKFLGWYSEKENGIKIESTTLYNNTNELYAYWGKIGDTNLDGKINIRDATAIQLHLSEYKPLSVSQLEVADTNVDGTINISDATHLQMYIAQYDVKLG